MCDKNQHIWRVEGSGEGSDHPRIACVVCFLGRFNESAAPVWPWSTVYSADRIMNLPAIHSKLEKRFSWSQGWWYSWWKNSPRCTKFSFARFSRNLHHQTYHFVVFFGAANLPASSPIVSCEILQYLAMMTRCVLQLLLVVTTRAHRMCPWCSFWCVFSFIKSKFSQKQPNRHSALKRQCLFGDLKLALCTPKDIEILEWNWSVYHLPCSFPEAALCREHDQRWHDRCLQLHVRWLG